MKRDADAAARPPRATLREVRAPHGYVVVQRHFKGLRRARIGHLQNEAFADAIRRALRARNVIRIEEQQVAVEEHIRDGVGHGAREGRVNRLRAIDDARPIIICIGLPALRRRRGPARHRRLIDAVGKRKRAIHLKVEESAAS